MENERKNPTTSFNVIWNYLNSCFNLKIENFNVLLAEDVELEHTTNEKIYRAKGKTDVMKL